jgi:hypothetical protein
MIRRAPSLLRALRIELTSLPPGQVGGGRSRCPDGQPSAGPHRCRARRAGRPVRALGVIGQPGQRTNSSKPRLVAVDDQQCGRRREVSVAALGQFASGEAGRIDPDQGLERPPRALPTAITDPPSAPLRTSATTFSQRRKASSAARRSGRSSSSGVSSRTARRSRTPPAARPRRGHHDRRRVRAPGPPPCPRPTAVPVSGETPCPAPPPSARRR